MQSGPGALQCTMPMTRTERTESAFQLTWRCMDNDNIV